MPELEEPGWPNLRSGAPSPGATFLNAFYAMSQINDRKRALEERIRQMQMNEGLKELNYQRMMDKQEQDSYFKQANLNRAYDMMALQNVWKDRQMTDLEQRTQDHVAKKDADLTNAGAMRDELNAWGQKYADDLGGTEAQMARTLIEDKYSTVLGTVEGQRQMKDFSSRMNAAQVQAHKNADMMRKQLDFGSKVLGVEKRDWSQGDEVWQKNDKGQRFYAFQAVPSAPGSTNLYRKYLTEKELKSMTADQQKAAGVRFSSSIDEDTYQTMKDLANQVTKRSSTTGSLRGMPAPTENMPSQRDIEWIKTHPEHAKYFDARFGDGASSQWIGAQ